MALPAGKRKKAKKKVEKKDDTRMLTILTSYEGAVIIDKEAYRRVLDCTRVQHLPLPCNHYAEFAPYHLEKDDLDILEYNSRCKPRPPKAEQPEFLFDNLLAGRGPENYRYEKPHTAAAIRTSVRDQMGQWALERAQRESDLLWRQEAARFGSTRRLGFHPNHPTGGSRAEATFVPDVSSSAAPEDTVVPAAEPLRVRPATASPAGRSSTWLEQTVQPQAIARLRSALPMMGAWVQERPRGTAVSAGVRSHLQSARGVADIVIHEEEEESEVDKNSPRDNSDDGQSFIQDDDATAFIQDDDGEIGEHHELEDVTGTLFKPRAEGRSQPPVGASDNNWAPHKRRLRQRPISAPAITPSQQQVQQEEMQPQPPPAPRQRHLALVLAGINLTAEGNERSWGWDDAISARQRASPTSALTVTTAMPAWEPGSTTIPSSAATAAAPSPAFGSWVRSTPSAARTFSALSSARTVGLEDPEAAYLQLEMESRRAPMSAITVAHVEEHFSKKVVSTDAAKKDEKGAPEGGDKPGAAGDNKTGKNRPTSAATVRSLKPQKPKKGKLRGGGRRPASAQAKLGSTASSAPRPGSAAAKALEAARLAAEALANAPRKYTSAKEFMIAHFPTGEVATAEANSTAPLVKEQEAEVASVMDAIYAEGVDHTNDVGDSSSSAVARKLRRALIVPQDRNIEEVLAVGLGCDSEAAAEVPIGGWIKGGYGAPGHHAFKGVSKKAILHKHVHVQKRVKKRVAKK